jgi:hypothetical protein
MKKKSLVKATCVALALVAALAVLLSAQGAWAAPAPPGTVTITQIGAQTTLENSPLIFTVTATTTGDRNLNFNLGNGPTGAVLTPANQVGKSRTATFIWTPTYDQAGVYNVIITSSEAGNGGGSAQTAFSITVGNRNRPPILNSITTPQSVNENATLTITLSGSDPDGDALTFSASSMPSGASFSGNTFTWTPNYQQAGNYEVLVTVTDNGITGGNPDPLPASQKVAISVGNVNRPPAFTILRGQTANAGEELSFTVNASDPDSDDTLTYSATNVPAGANFVPATQAFTWTPGYDQAGNYTVTFTVSDGHVSVNQDVTITVNANRPPVLGDIGDQQAFEGKPLSFVVSGSDPDGGALTYSYSSLPPGAQFDPATRTFSWTPDWGQLGNYSVTFTVTDSGTPPLSDSKTINISVGHTNRKPTLNPIGSKDGLEGTKMEFSVSGSDPDGGVLTFTADDGSNGPLPAGAQFDSTTRTFTWTPGYDQEGTYFVTFYVTDDGGLVAQETVTISIGNVNRPPIFTAIGPKTGKEGETLTFAVSATDPDGDKIAYSCSQLPAGAEFDATTCTFTWPIAYGQADTYPIKFYAKDNGTPAPQTNEIGVVITVNQPSPSELINNIVQYVYSLHLDKNVENSYIANLKKVDGFITKGQLTPAINQLNATVQKVDQDLKKGGLITSGPAAQLKLMINELLTMLTK